MSFKEIKELRQAGKLDEALEMANQVLEAEPENIWNKRAAAWVYYDYLKKYAQPDTFDLFKKNLEKIKNLRLPDDEKMVFDNCAWQIGKILFALQKTVPVEYQKINELFDIIRDFHFSKPSESYTFIYKAFHKGYKKWSKYLEFADWWNFEHFRKEDHLSEKFNNRKIMSIVERAYIAYSKRLLMKDSMDSYRQHDTIDSKRIRSFLQKLNALIKRHSDYQYLLYYKSKLLLALGKNKEALTSLLPFARKKRKEFWIWKLMAEIITGDKEIQFACYCKALSLNVSEKYLGKIRLEFAKMLKERGMYNEAKTEILKIKATHEKYEWSLPYQLKQWIKTDWYKRAIAKKNNRDVYLQYLKMAEKVCNGQIPEEAFNEFERINYERVKISEQQKKEFNAIIERNLQAAKSTESTKFTEPTTTTTTTTTKPSEDLRERYLNFKQRLAEGKRIPAAVPYSKKVFTPPSIYNTDKIIKLEKYLNRDGSINNQVVGRISLEDLFGGDVEVIELLKAGEFEKAFSKWFNEDINLYDPNLMKVSDFSEVKYEIVDGIGINIVDVMINMMTKNLEKYLYFYEIMKTLFSYDRELFFNIYDLIRNDDIFDDEDLGEGYEESDDYLYKNFVKYLNKKSIPRIHSKKKFKPLKKVYERIPSEVTVYSNNTVSVKGVYSLEEVFEGDEKVISLIRKGEIEKALRLWLGEDDLKLYDENLGLKDVQLSIFDENAIMINTKLNINLFDFLYGILTQEKGLLKHKRVSMMRSLLYKAPEILFNFDDYVERYFKNDSKK